MKRFQWLATLCLALMTMPLMANDSSPVKPTTDILVSSKIVGGKTVKLKVSNLQMEKTAILLTDLQGNNTFYRDFVKDHNGYGRRLNLDQLPVGKYMLTVKQKDENVKQIIVVKENYLLLSSSNHSS
ncbi:MAG: hypothetical protein R2828_07340 [Saprospiraceae bacterium]